MDGDDAVNGDAEGEGLLREAARDAANYIRGDDIMAFSGPVGDAIADRIDAALSALPESYWLDLAQVYRDEAAALAVQNAELQARAERAEAAIAWANNSLFGSHGFFLSTNGGPPDEHHLDAPIENLKATDAGSGRWRRLRRMKPPSSARPSPRRQERWSPSQEWRRAAITNSTAPQSRSRSAICAAP